MTNRSFNNAHLAELARMAEQSKADPVLGPQDQARLSQMQQDSYYSTAQGNEAPAPQAAIYFSGEAVWGTSGIDARLAGEALVQYGRMFTEQAMVDERAAAERKRRPKGAAEPTVLFTGTPRGSFGFQFAPNPIDDELDRLHIETIHKLTEMIVKVAESSGVDGSDAAVIDDHVLPYLRLFFKAIASKGVSMRLVTARGVRKSFDANVVKSIAARLERSVEQEMIKVEGTFRGLTLETGHFDFISDNEEIISGTSSAGLSPEDMSRIQKLTDQRCTIVYEWTRIKHLGRAPVEKYELYDAQPLADE